MIINNEHNLPLISKNELEDFQRFTFTRSGKFLRNQNETVDWVNTRGLVFFWPIKDFPFPSLWFAVAKDRPVTYEDTRNVTWGWKDEALGKRIGYYGKLLKRKSTFVSMDIAPYFFALTNNYGIPKMITSSNIRKG